MLEIEISEEVYKEFKKRKEKDEFYIYIINKGKEKQFFLGFKKNR